MKKLNDTDKKLFGDYALLVSGFEEFEQESILLTSKEHNALLKVVFAKQEDSKSSLQEIFSKDDKYGYKNTLYPKRALIMSGFLEKEIAEFMKKIYSLRLVSNLWAVLTPTSQNWKLSELLEELEKEDRELKKTRMQES